MNYFNRSFVFICFLLELKKSFCGEAETSVAPSGAPASECGTGQRFDGPSFIGGIVLAVGVVAIGYVLWRYFQSKRQTGMTFNDI